MITEKLLIPWCIAAKHPLFHLSCMVMGWALKFDFLKSEIQVHKDFEDTLTYMIRVHILCMVLDCIHKGLELLGLGDKENLDPYKYVYIQKMCVLLKLFIYFFSIAYTQEIVLRHADNTQKQWKKSDVVNHTSVFLLYEVLLFYLNMGSLMVFLIFSRVISFKTLKERFGYNGLARYEIDFLEFVQEDIHWVLVVLSQFFLYCFIIRFTKYDD